MREYIALAIMALALAAGAATIACGAYAYLVLMVSARRGAGSGELGDVLGPMMGGTVIFVLACLATALELRFPAWIIGD